jgi:hypothetical protein
MTQKYQIRELGDSSQKIPPTGYWILYSCYYHYFCFLHFERVSQD